MKNSSYKLEVLTTTTLNFFDILLLSFLFKSV